MVTQTICSGGVLSGSVCPGGKMLLDLLSRLHRAPRGQSLLDRAEKSGLSSAC